MTDSPVEPRAPAEPAPKNIPINIVPLASLFLLGFAGIVVTCLWLAGMVTGDSFIDLGISSAMTLGAALLWQLVEKQRGRPGEDIQPIAWVAFPFSILLFLGQTPFLARAIYPPIQDFFLKDGQVETRYVERPDGLKLELSFPKPLASARGDLRINSSYLPLDCFSEEAGLVKWPRERVLVISVPEILARLGEKRVDSISLNLRAVKSPDEEQKLPGRLLYADGRRVEPQTIHPGEY
jgi:hypothetical protein